MAFRLACYADLKRYAGSLSAKTELIELSVLEFESEARASFNEEEFIKRVAIKHSRHVHFKTCPPLTVQTSLISITAVITAFEDFLAKFKSEYSELAGVSWKHYEKKSDLFVALQNVYGGQTEAKRIIGSMQVSLGDYYRLVRNAAMHDDAKEGIDDAFSEVVEYQKPASEAYSKLGLAPNRFSHLTREDFLLCIRVLQDIAWALSLAARPSEERFIELLRPVAEGLRSRLHCGIKTKSALRNYLLHKYGLETAEADILVNRIL